MIPSCSIWPSAVSNNSNWNIIAVIWDSWIILRKPSSPTGPRAVLTLASYTVMTVVPIVIILRVLRVIALRTLVSVTWNVMTCEYCIDFVRIIILLILVSVSCSDSGATWWHYEAIVETREFEGKHEQKATFHRSVVSAISHFCTNFSLTTRGV